MLPALLALVASGCADAEARSWHMVFEDENHTVAFDPDDVTRLGPATYLVWYRTDHARPRMRDGRTWNREVALTVLRCEGLWFKLRSVDLSDGDEVISRQRTSEAIDRQPWRRVARGTGEEEVARAVCRHVEGTAPRASMRRGRAVARQGSDGSGYTDRGAAAEPGSGARRSGAPPSARSLQSVRGPMGRAG